MPPRQTRLADNAVAAAKSALPQDNLLSKARCCGATTIWPAGEQGVRYRAIAGGYTWPARAPDAVVIARGYGTTAAIAFTAARTPGGDMGGDVALNGTVPSYPQYLEAATAARRVVGVTSVHKTPPGGGAAARERPRRPGTDHRRQQRARAERHRPGWTGTR